MLLQQMLEIEDGRLIRRRLTAEVDAGKAAHRTRLIQGFLRTRAREVNPMLQEVDAQHPLQTNQWTSMTRPGIERFNLLTQPTPRHLLVHLGKKLFPMRRLAVTLKVISRKGLLSHRYQPMINNARIIADVRT